MKFRREQLGFIFQDFNLLDTLNAFDNIALALQIQGKKPDEIKKKVREISEKLNVEETLKKYPYEMSGGQRQRIACARAMVTEPSLILADEPTGNLDSQNSSEVISLLKTASKRYQQTILMITHNRGIASAADRVLQVSDGILTDLGGYAG